MDNIKIMELKAYVSKQKAQIIRQYIDFIQQLTKEDVEKLEKRHTKDDIIDFSMGTQYFAGEEMFFEDNQIWILSQGLNSDVAFSSFDEKFDATNMSYYDAFKVLPSEAYFDDQYHTFRRIFSDNEIEIIASAWRSKYKEFGENVRVIYGWNRIKNNNTYSIGVYKED